jgi:alpha-D-xyloside xylohydrolase
MASPPIFQFRRERLHPYIHEQMRLAAVTGLPAMRPLFVDYPNDPKTWGIEDQFLFGPDVLVAPVYSPGTRRRPVYLPQHSRWTHGATGEVHHGV